MRKKSILFFVCLAVLASVSCGQQKEMKESSLLFPVKQDGKWGYIDKTGKIVINPQFDSATSFSKGLARVVIGDKWGYIDKTGKIVINPQFDSAASFCDGLARVVIGDKWGYIDKTESMSGSLQNK